MKSVVIALSALLLSTAPCLADNPNAHSWNGDTTPPSAEQYLLSQTKLTPDGKLTTAPTQLKGAITPEPDRFSPYLRRDQIVVDSTTGKPTPPAGMIVLKKLVDSKTVIDGTYVYAPGTILKGKRKLVGNKFTSYEYLVDTSSMPAADIQKYVAEGKLVTEDNVHYFMWTRSKIQGIQDLRNWAIIHPREARYLAFMDRWYQRLQPIIVPASVIANALIIKG